MTYRDWGCDPLAAECESCLNALCNACEEEFRKQPGDPEGDDDPDSGCHDRYEPDCDRCDLEKQPDCAGCQIILAVCRDCGENRTCEFRISDRAPGVRRPVTIEPVADHPGLHDTIAGWLWNEWGTAKNRGLYGSLVAHCRRDTLPAIWVAFDNGTPAGTVGLLRTDLLSRQEFTPWMAVLYVKPEYRGQGIAAQLQEHALAEAVRMGFPALFLYTKLAGFYEKSGWVFRETDVDDHGETIRIYQKDL